jgi:HD-GYP domain-containing protein (c-di-GMP phosphodiesterase class II)
MSEATFPVTHAVPAAPPDTEVPAIHEQLIVFARELGALYRLERSRSAELEIVLQNLQDTYIATMKSLAQVIEAKDSTTRGHLERTQAYGLALTRRIDGELESPTLGYGFFLHDIGKVGIPEHILCKGGPLSGAEWDVMRTHPVIGAQIVAPMSFLTTTVELIRHHHEWFDGSGYPDGLRGDAIPLPARIFAVADSFDAMTSDRPYRGSIGIERALAEIRGGSGSQFDPEVVRVFVQMIDDGPAGDERELAAALRHAG